MRTTTTKNNACLLHALNDAPGAAPATDDQIQGLRAAIAAAAVEYKHMIVNDKTLDAWVKLTADVDTETPHSRPPSVRTNRGAASNT